MNASELYQSLLAYETSSSSPPDGARVIGNERQTLYIWLDRVSGLERSAERQAEHPMLGPELAQNLADARRRLSEVTTEAERVARMWRVL